MTRSVALVAILFGSAACGGEPPPPIHVPVADVTAPPSASTAAAPIATPPLRMDGLATRPIAPSSSVDWGAAQRADAVYRDNARSYRDRDEAHYRVGAALDRLGLFVAAYGIYAEVATRKQSPFRAEVLVRFGEIANDPVARGVDLVERLGVFAVAELDAPRLADTRGDLLHLRGLYLYRNHQWAEAVKELTAVPKTSASYARAQVLAGLCYVQMHQGKGAVEAFRAASTTTDESVRSLAALSVARTLYSGGFERAATGGFNVKYAPAAISFYEQVKAEPFAREAAFELAWAKHYGADDAGALRALALLTKRADPPPPSSALLFEAYLYWRGCRYDDARASLDALEKTYTPFVTAATRELTALAGDEHDHEWYRIALGSTPVAGLGPWMPSLRSRGTLALTLAYVEEAKREEAALKANAPPSFATSELGADVRDALQLTHDIGERNTRELLRGELTALTEQVQSDLRGVRPLRDAIAAGLRGGLDAAQRADQVCPKK